MSPPYFPTKKCDAQTPAGSLLELILKLNEHNINLKLWHSSPWSAHQNSDTTQLLGDAPIHTFRLNTVRHTWALSSFLFPFWLNSLQASALLRTPPLFSCALATSHRLVHRSYPDRGPRTPKQGFSTYDNTLFIPIFNHFQVIVKGIVSLNLSSNTWSSLQER